MTQRIQARSLFNDKPFADEGYSLYVNAGSTVAYRRKRLAGRRRFIKGSGGIHNIAAASVLKTARVATDTESPIAYTLPAELASQTIAFDVRHWKDGIENETDNFRIGQVTLDGDPADVTGILGTATLLSIEARAGGVVRIRFVYHASRSGVQPVQFSAIRTAGPTSPANATATYTAGQRLVEIDTPALSDASAYTYKIRAENGATTLDLLTGLAVTADATAPPAPSSGSTEAV